MNGRCFWLQGGGEVTLLVGGCAGASDRERCRLLAAYVSSKETENDAEGGKTQFAINKTCSSYLGQI